MLGCSGCGQAGGTVCVLPSILLAAPSFSRILGRGSRSTLTSLLAKWFCAWVREGRGVILTWDKGGLCQVFTFPSPKGAAIPCRQSRACPGCAVGVQWVWQDWERAEALSLCGTEMCVCLPRHCQEVFWGSWGWFRESRKSAFVGEVQLQFSAGNLSYIFLFLKCAFCNLWIYCQELSWVSSVSHPEICFFITSAKKLFLCLDK